MTNQRINLEGKCVVYEYLEQDHITEGSAIAAYRIEKGTAKSIFNPGAVFDPIHLNEEARQAAIDFLKTNKISEVYALHNFSKEKTPFGIEEGYQCLCPESCTDETNEEDSEDSDSADSEGCQQWLEVRSLCDGTELEALLIENGIKVIHCQYTKSPVPSASRI